MAQQLLRRGEQTAHAVELGQVGETGHERRIGLDGRLIVSIGLAVVALHQELGAAIVVEACEDVVLREPVAGIARSDLGLKIDDDAARSERLPIDGHIRLVAHEHIDVAIDKLDAVVAIDDHRHPHLLHVRCEPQGVGCRVGQYRHGKTITPPLVPGLHGPRGMTAVVSEADAARPIELREQQVQTPLVGKSQALPIREALDHCGVESEQGLPCFGHAIAPIVKGLVLPDPRWRCAGHTGSGTPDQSDSHHEHQTQYSVAHGIAP